jgi:hypothetical protein
METIKKQQQKLLRAYRAAVCRFQDNPSDANIERITTLAQKLQALGYPVDSLFT